MRRVRVGTPLFVLGSSIIEKGFCVLIVGFGSSCRQWSALLYAHKVA